MSRNYWADIFAAAGIGLTILSGVIVAFAIAFVMLSQLLLKEGGHGPSLSMHDQ